MKLFDYRGSKALIYTRVSTKTQVKNGNGLKSQKMTCEEYRKREGIVIVGYYEDGGISGGKSDRKGMKELIKFLEKENKYENKVSYVIVDDIDRIARDIEIFIRFKGKLKSLGVSILSVKMNLEETPEGEMLQNITMSVKQYERENNTRRVNGRTRTRILDGYRCASSIPGYKYIKDPSSRGGKILVLDEEKGPVLGEGLTLYANGVIPNNQAELARYFNDRGLTSLHGKPIKRGFIQRLLTKQRLLLYAGYIYMPSKGLTEPFKGRHEQIITLDTATKILEMYHRKELNVSHSKSDIALKMPLRGLVLCDTCGCRMTGGPTKNKLGNYYFYYHCRNDECEYKGKSTQVTEMHTELYEYLKGLEINESIIPTFRQAIDNARKTASDHKKNDSKTLSKQLENMSSKIERIQDAIFESDDASIRKTYEERLKKLLAEKDSLALKKEGKESEDTSDLVQTLNEAINIIQNPHKLRDLESYEIKKVMINILFGEKLKYNKKSGFQTLETPLLYSTISLFGSTSDRQLEVTGVEPVSRRHTQ